MQIENILPLKPLQTSMAYNYFLNPESRINAEMLVYKIDGKPDVKRMAESCALTTYNKVMKSIFYWKNTNQPLQIIVANQTLYLEKVYAQCVSEELAKIWNMKIDITQKPYRVFLIENNANLYLVIRTNHILLDGWSQTIWVKKFMELYDHLEQPEPQCIKRIDYVSYIKMYWNRAIENREYWLNAFHGYADSQRVKSRKSCTKSQKVFVYQSRHLKKNLNSIARTNELTVSQCIYAITANNLIKTKNSTDITFNIVSSGRDNYAIDAPNIVGMLMNVIPARLKINLSWSIRQHLMYIRQKSIEMIEHQEIDTIDLFGTLENGYKINIDTCIDIQNHPISSLKTVANHQFSLSLAEHRFHTNIPLTLAVRFDDPTVEIEFSYDDGLFHTRGIQRMIESIESIAECLYDSEKILADLIMGVE